MLSILLVATVSGQPLPLAYEIQAPTPVVQTFVRSEWEAFIPKPNPEPSGTRGTGTR